MVGDGGYRSEAEEVFYGQLVEDQKEYIDWEIQQRETLHGGWEEGVIDQSILPPSLVDKREQISCIFQIQETRKICERKTAEWRGKGRILNCSLYSNNTQDPFPLTLTRHAAILQPRCTTWLGENR